MTNWKRVKISPPSSVVQKEQHSYFSFLRSHFSEMRFLKLPRPSLITAVLGVLMVVVVLFMLLNVVGGGFTGGVGKALFSNVAQIFGEDLQKDEQGKTNILLVGVGGGDHEGPDLTDTIMLASIDHELQSVSLFSVPRDLYVSIPGVGGMKINGVFEYGLGKGRYGAQNEMGDPARAMTVLEDMVAKVVGVDIQYYIKVDFQGFVDIVNQLGGIEVDVPQRFVDRQYPDGNFGYMTFFLPAGRQQLDGETALKYARSRYSTSDFDRAGRQQAILAAIREKALDKNILTNPSQIKRLYYALNSNIETDLNVREILSLGSFAAKLDQKHISSMVLTDDPTTKGGFLYTPMRDLFGGASVLLPEGASVGNLSQYKQIHLLAKVFFGAPELYYNPPKIKIYNGTQVGSVRVSGVATKISQVLTRFGIDIERADNFPRGMVSDTSLLVYFDTSYEANILDAFDLLFPLEHRLVPVEKTEQGNQDISAPTSPASTEEGMVTMETLLAQDGQYYDLVIVIGNDYKDYLSR